MSRTAAPCPGEKGQGWRIKWKYSLGSQLARQRLHHFARPGIHGRLPLAGKALEHRGPGIADQHDEFCLAHVISGKPAQERETLFDDARENGMFQDARL